jgi:polysaccharide biosynthesis/export protein
MRIRSLIAVVLFGTLLAYASGAAAQQAGARQGAAPRAPATAPQGPAAAQPPVVSQPGAGVAAGAAKPDDGYVLGPEDVVEVEVVGRSDFKVRAKVGSDGTIPLPFIGSVNAATKTSRQLAEDVRQALERGGYFVRPIMRVEVVSYASRYVTVLGQVVNPGLVPVDRAYRLSEILARVGGVRENGADYVVLRPENGPEQRRSVKELAMGDPARDPFVSPGDKIYAPEAEIFYISGQVRAPGAYPVASDMTLRMALAKGGGLTDLGSERAIKVTRGSKVSKLGLNEKILPGDVVVVGERLF